MTLKAFTPGTAGGLAYIIKTGQSAARLARLFLCPFGGYAVDERLHFVGACLPHFVGDVAVGVQRKCRRVMAEIALHCFDIIAGL